MSSEFKELSCLKNLALLVQSSELTFEEIKKEVPGITDLRTLAVFLSDELKLNIPLMQKELGISVALFYRWKEGAQPQDHRQKALVKIFNRETKAFFQKKEEEEKAEEERAVVSQKIKASLVEEFGESISPYLENNPVPEALLYDILFTFNLKKVDREKLSDQEKEAASNWILRGTFPEDAKREEMLLFFKKHAEGRAKELFKKFKIIRDSMKDVGRYDNSQSLRHNLNVLGGLAEASNPQSLSPDALVKILELMSPLLKEKSSKGSVHELALFFNVPGANVSQWKHRKINIPIYYELPLVHIYNKILQGDLETVKIAFGVSEERALEIIEFVKENKKKLNEI